MFSVAKQTIVDPESGLSLSFDTDPADYAKVQCTVTMKDAKDYLSLVFNRNGVLVSSQMVKYEEPAETTDAAPEGYKSKSEVPA